MIIANGKDFHVIDDIMKGQEKGTLFLAHKSEKFNILDYIEPEKSSTEEKKKFMITDADIKRINELYHKSKK